MPHHTALAHAARWAVTRPRAKQRITRPWAKVTCHIGLAPRAKVSCHIALAEVAGKARGQGPIGYFWGSVIGYFMLWGLVFRVYAEERG